MRLPKRAEERSSWKEIDIWTAAAATVRWPEDERRAAAAVMPEIWLLDEEVRIIEL